MKEFGMSILLRSLNLSLKRPMSLNYDMTGSLLTRHIFAERLSFTGMP